MSGEQSIVRAAQPQDEAGIMALCRLMHAETGMFSMNEDKVLRMIRRAWSMDRVLIGVIGSIGEPVAIAALTLSDTWYSDDQFIGDFMVFVHPKHRQSGHAKALLRYAKKVSDGLNVPMTIGVIGPTKLGKSLSIGFDRVMDPDNLAGGSAARKRTLRGSSEDELKWRAQLRYYRREFGEPAGFYFLYMPKMAEPAKIEEAA